MSGKLPVVITILLLGGLTIFAAWKSFAPSDSEPPGGSAQPPPPSEEPKGDGPPHGADPSGRFPRPYDEPAVDVPSEGRGVVAGTVLGPDGEPVSGVEVTLLAEGVNVEDIRDPFGDGEQTERPPSFLPTSARSDSKGRFAISTGHPGPFTVTARCSGFAEARAEKVALDTEDLEIELGFAGALRGVVVAEGGAPVDGAKVSAAGDETVTDAAGSFTLADLPPGSSVALEVRATGYEAASIGVMVPMSGVTDLLEPLVLKPLPGIAGRVLDPAGKPLPEASVSVEGGLFLGRFGVKTDAGGRFLVTDVESGEVALDVRHREYLPKTVEGIEYEKGTRREVPDVHLEPGGVISGRVTDQGGEPVIGARVRAWPTDAGQDISRLTYLVMSRGRDPTSDAEGRFRIAGLETGAYKLSVLARGYQAHGMEGVSVRVPETTTVGVKLSRGASIEGVVVDSDGDAIEGAAVEVGIGPSAVNVRNIEDAMLPGPTGDEARTAEDGSFVVWGLTAGRPADLRISAEGFVPTDMEEVEPGTADLEVTLLRAGGLSGRVLDAETEEPVPNADVRAGGRRASTNKEDGSFVLEGVPPGEQEVRVTAVGYAPGRVEGVAVDEGEVTDGVEIRLERGESLAGVVVRAVDGSPIAGVAVRVGGPVTLNGTTDAAGRFEIRGLVPGFYELTARADDHATARLEGVKVPSPAEIRVEMVRGGTIRGIVRDAGGQPVSQRMVMLGEGGAFGGDQKTTDGEGRFTFENVVPGKYGIIAIGFGGQAGGGFSTESRSVTVREGEEVFVEIGGTPEASKAHLTGRLLDRGTPLASRMLMFLPSDPGGGMIDFMSSFKMITTDREGRFDVKDLTPGRYRVFAGFMGGETGVGIDLEISESGEVSQDIAMPEGIFSGRVVRADSGSAVAGAKVMLADGSRLDRPVSSISDMMGVLLAQVVTDEDGNFELPNAPVGTHTVEVAADDLAPVILTGVRVTPEGGGLRITLPAGHEVEVAVTDRDGSPLRDASVIVLDGAGRRFFVPDELSLEVGPDGKVTTRLARGTYRLIVQCGTHAQAEREIRVSGDRKESFSLVEGGALHVTVTGPSGPVDGAVVRVFRTDGREIAHHLTQRAMMTGTPSRETGEDGLLVLAHLPPGSHRVVVTGPEGRRGEANTRITEGGQAAVAVRLK